RGDALRHAHDLVELDIVAHIFDEMAGMHDRRPVATESASYLGHAQAHVHMGHIHADLATAGNADGCASRLTQLAATYVEKRRQYIKYTVTYVRNSLLVYRTQFSRTGCSTILFALAFFGLCNAWFRSYCNRCHGTPPTQRNMILIILVGRS